MGRPCADSLQTLRRQEAGPGDRGGLRVTSAASDRCFLLVVRHNVLMDVTWPVMLDRVPDTVRLVLVGARTWVSFLKSFELGFGTRVTHAMDTGW